jgi:hypothetical protein
MSTQFDEVFDGLSKNALTLEDACRVLFSELRASPENMRVCCERIESELSQGRISSDAAQLLLDALGEHGEHGAQADADPGEEVWVEVPLEPVMRRTVERKAPSDTLTEVDLTVEDLLAALDRRSPGVSRSLPAADFDVADEQAASVEWVEWEPEPLSQSGQVTASAQPLPVSSAIAPAADDAVAASATALEQPAPSVAMQDVDADSLQQTAAIESAADLPELALAEPLPVAIVVPSELAVAGEPAANDAPEQPPPELGAQPAEQAAPAAEWQAASQPAVAPEPTPAPERPEPAQVGSIGSISPAIAELAQPPSSDAVFVARFDHVLRESSPTPPGALLNGRYQVMGTLEPGGFGALLDAIDTQTEGGPRVTLKMIEVDWQEEPRAFDTLRAIVRHVRRLRHPNILSILDIDRDDKHAIVVMEPLQGRWLSALIREVRARGVGFAVAWNIISGIANGLAYAHQHGAVHAELNPHMVFLTEEGAVKIAGFGLAQAVPMSTEPLAVLDGLRPRDYADAYSVTNWVHGSMPQEADDLYPLGVIAYELLTGAHPFDRFSPAEAAARQMQPSQIPGLDRRIRKVIERCLSFDRQARPVNGANFLAHIEPSEQLLESVRERFKKSVSGHSA